MLGLQNSITSNQRFNNRSLGRRQSNKENVRPSFGGKRKRSDSGMSDQPAKQRRTSLEFDVKINDDLKLPSSFTQPLSPFECSAKVCPIKEFKNANRIFRPLVNGTAVKVNTGRTGRGVLASMDLAHPASELCKAKSRIGKLSKRIRRLEEQNQYWRRKSLTLGSENVQLKQELDRMKNAVKQVESERLELQTKLMRAESDGSKCAMEIQSLLLANKDLTDAVNELNEELAMFSNVNDGTTANVEMQDVSPEHVAQIEQALADTLADLTDKIDEIEELKQALAAMSAEKNQLDEVVTRQTILSEMLDMEGDADQCSEDKEGCAELAKIGRLQGAVEKCMFRIALLSEKNEEYKAVIRAARDANRPPSSPEGPSILRTLHDGQKVQILESLCMQRYRTLLREAAESLVGHEVNSSMNESF